VLHWAGCVHVTRLGALSAASLKLGVHLLAPHAGDLVAHAMTLVRNHNTIEDVLESLPMFPTLSEAIKLVALAFTRDISKVSCCV